MKNKNILIALGVFLAVVLVGAFSIRKPAIKNSPNSSPSGSLNQSATPTKEIEIVANEYSFTPNLLTVQKGDKISISLRNAGAITHSLFIEGYNVGISAVAPGKSATLSFTADKSGTFAFYCNIDGHRDLGMQGTLEIK